MLPLTPTSDPPPHPTLSPHRSYAQADVRVMQLERAVLSRQEEMDDAEEACDAAARTAACPTPSGRGFAATRQLALRLGRAVAQAVEDAVELLAAKKQALLDACGSEREHARCRGRGGAPPPRRARMCACARAAYPRCPERISFCLGPFAFLPFIRGHRRRTRTCGGRRARSRSTSCTTKRRSSPRPPRPRLSRPDSYPSSGLGPEVIADRLTPALSPRPGRGGGPDRGARW